MFLRYCIDMFSSGRENETFVNGFYCPINEKGFVKGRNFAQDVVTEKYADMENATKEIALKLQASQTVLREEKSGSQPLITATTRQLIFGAMAVLFIERLSYHLN